MQQPAAIARQPGHQEMQVQDTAPLLLDPPESRSAEALNATTRILEIRAAALRGVGSRSRAEGTGNQMQIDGRIQALNPFAQGHQTPFPRRGGEGTDVATFRSAAIPHPHRPRTHEAHSGAGHHHSVASGPRIQRPRDPPQSPTRSNAITIAKISITSIHHPPPNGGNPPKQAHSRGFLHRRTPCPTCPTDAAGSPRGAVPQPRPEPENEPR